LGQLRLALGGGALALVVITTGAAAAVPDRARPGGESGLPVAGRASGGGPHLRDAVLSARSSEINPAVLGSTFMWAQNSRRHPRHFDTFLKVSGSSRQRLNIAGTESFSGGIFGDDLVFQVKRKSRSDLRMFDLASEQFVPTPAGVNTERWEWAPTISADHLLFGRIGRTSRVILFDRSSGAQIQLAESSRFLRSGQVAGNYAVYERCGARSCDVYRYDIAAETRTVIPRPSNVRWQYTPAVDPDGTVYFFRSATGCGNNVRLLAQPLIGPAVPLLQLPDGREAFDAYVDASGSDPVVYFDRVNCRTDNFDIHSLVVQP
ncbi:MAG: hypothetical protein WD206_08205, partial [Actinomycetota bacterium]